MAVRPSPLLLPGLRLPLTQNLRLRRHSNAGILGNPTAGGLATLCEKTPTVWDDADALNMPRDLLPSSSPRSSGMNSPASVASSRSASPTSASDTSDYSYPPTARIMLTESQSGTVTPKYIRARTGVASMPVMRFNLCDKKDIPSGHTSPFVGTPEAWRDSPLYVLPDRLSVDHVREASEILFVDPSSPVSVLSDMASPLNCFPGTPSSCVGSWAHKAWFGGLSAPGDDDCDGTTQAADKQSQLDGPGSFVAPLPMRVSSAPATCVSEKSVETATVDQSAACALSAPPQAAAGFVDRTCGFCPTVVNMGAPVMSWPLMMNVAPGAFVSLIPVAPSGVTPSLYPAASNVGAGDIAGANSSQTTKTQMSQSATRAVSHLTTSSNDSTESASDDGTSVAPSSKRPMPRAIYIDLGNLREKSLKRPCRG